MAHATTLVITGLYWTIFCVLRIGSSHRFISGRVALRIRAARPATIPYPHAGALAEERACRQPWSRREDASSPALSPSPLSPSVAPHAARRRSWRHWQARLAEARHHHLLRRRVCLLLPQCVPVSSSNAKGRGVSPATPCGTPKSLWKSPPVLLCTLWGLRGLQCQASIHVQHAHAHGHAHVHVHVRVHVLHNSITSTTSALSST